MCGCVLGMLTKETKAFEFPYLYINRRFVIRKNAVPEEKKKYRWGYNIVGWKRLSNIPRICCLASFSPSFSLWGEDTICLLLVFRPSMMDRFCLKIFIIFSVFFFDSNKLWSYTQSLSLSFLSIPLRVLASSLRFFPRFHRITVYSDEIWRGCLRLLARNDAILPPPRPTFRFDHP